MSFCDKDQPGVVWDFECPLCGDQWNHEGDPFEQEEAREEECPGCDKTLEITASYSVEYTLEPKSEGRGKA